ncbi:MAG: sigma-70 family RNA polymerase sigma factor [Clostridia bacterium]|nr:sigma-70 family RNA polymerase sigma factor [Clostridia bacterium]
MEQLHKRAGELLITIACNEDKDAIEELFEIMYVPMSGVVYKLTKDQFESDDIVCEAFLDIVRIARAYREPYDAYNYLCVSIRNKTIDYMRSEKSRVERERKYVTELGLNASISDFARIEFQDLISKLPVKERRILIMKYKGEMTYAEIAELMGLLITTIYRLCKRALEKLYKDEDDDKE